MEGKVIGIMSFKGGVGKTVSAINLASAFVKEGKKAIVIDGNFLSPNLHFYLGLLNPTKTLKEIIRENLAIENAIYEHKSGVHIIPCNFYKGIDFEKFKEVIKDLKNRYDYLILDSGPSYTEEVIAILMVSDELLFITTPDYPTLAATVKATRLAKYKDVKIRGIILNKKRWRGNNVSVEDIEKTTGIKVVSKIAEDSKMLKAIGVFSPVVWKYPRSKSSKAYIKLVKEIIRSS
jgi:MinD-like ATPase involved in chromosome partitioning or flagellar assembly